MRLPYPDPAFQDAPKRKNWFLDSPQLQFLTAIISLGTTLFSWYVSQKREVLIPLVLFCGIVFFMSVAPGIVVAIKFMRHRYAQQKFIKREYPVLQRLYQRLVSFSDRNDGRSLRNILYSASSYRHDVIDRLLATDYIWTWIESYGLGLKLEMPCSVLVFLKQCGELAAIVSEYNTNYAHATQKGINEVLPHEIHIIDQLEQFREDFNQFLRDLEEWANKINASAKDLLPNWSEHVRMLPGVWYEKVKTFRKGNAARS
jgi:hypothetical protein